MKRRIIHDNNCILRKYRQKNFFKPSLKKLTSHCSTVLHWSNYLVSVFCSNNICTFKFSYFYFAVNFLPSFWISIFMVQITVNSCFINVYSIFFINICYFPKVFLYLSFFLLIITQCLFSVLFQAFLLLFLLLQYCIQTLQQSPLKKHPGFLLKTMPVFPNQFF